MRFAIASFDYNRIYVMSNKILSSKKIVICIPTLNAGLQAQALAGKLKKQSAFPLSILIIDSSSTDNSLGCFSDIGARVHTI